MNPPMRHILVTGGAGFIGSAVCRHLIGTANYRVIVVDKLTYAASLASLDALAGHPNFRFERCDIADQARISQLLQDERIDCVIHLAAETHVDRSIRSPDKFIETNIVGTFHLLEAARRYWHRLDDQSRAVFRFHHVSTDEVFGDDASPNRELSYRPSSPYSASKAAADHLVAAWRRTYGLPVIMSHSCNSYGPYQFPDKLIPLLVTNAIEEQPLPIYGTGANERDWIYVDDHARALERVLTRGEIGRSYSIGQRPSRSNLQVARSICRLLDVLRPRRGRSYEDLITFVPDRPGHDRRYATGLHGVDSELGWAPQETFDTGLAKTVRWYLEREDWWRPLRNG